MSKANTANIHHVQKTNPACGHDLALSEILYPRMEGYDPLLRAYRCRICGAVYYKCPPVGYSHSKVIQLPLIG